MRGNEVKRSFLLSCLVVLALSNDSLAQQGIIAASRSIDWSSAGVTGGIPNRTTACATFSPGATAAQINTAIASCPSGQVVLLTAGTYNLTTGIIFNNKKNVTLRGAGANATFLIFTGDQGCSGIAATICLFNGNANYNDQPGNTANWTAGYAQGATQLTFSSTTNLQVGTLVILDQLADSSDDGSIFQAAIHGTTCVGCDEVGRTGRPQTQIVTVTAINGSTVTITPNLYMPNWRSDRSPGAWWSNNLPVSGNGVEALSIDNSAITSGWNTVTIYNGRNNWVKGVRSVNPRRHHVEFWQSAHNTVRDSYFFKTQQNTEESYGIEGYLSSDELIENNIFQRISNPILWANTQGDVSAYNFSINDFFSDGTWAMQSSFTHAPGTNYGLFEGNDGYGMMLEDYHGPSHFMTAFRNRWIGFESGNTSQTLPVYVQAFNRFPNILGNVLGTSTYHNRYQWRSGIESSNQSSCYHSIYSIGWGGNCQTNIPRGVIDDPTGIGTVMRWGNWDTVSNATKWDASEVPSGLAKYANPVPSMQTLPASLYLSAKPSFMGAVPWPPIGPDVSGGDISNVGGHAYRIPARRCFEDVLGGNFGDTTARTFNADQCYGAAPPPAPPAPPTNLRITGAAVFSLPVFPVLLRFSRRRR